MAPLFARTGDPRYRTLPRALSGYSKFSNSRTGLDSYGIYGRRHLRDANNGDPQNRYLSRIPRSVVDMSEQGADQSPPHPSFIGAGLKHTSPEKNPNSYRRYHDDEKKSALLVITVTRRTHYASIYLTIWGVGTSAATCKRGYVVNWCTKRKTHRSQLATLIHPLTWKKHSGLLYSTVQTILFCGHKGQPLRLQYPIEQITTRDR
ncbi:hypothetical protein BJV78DRAFT_1155692 [Lactifluus subvellereus]|nr:hypothetical protein BJV78DRAFT_1155692 [Lactifluus subvellereus]